jgi:hypothetical protein
VRSVPVIEETLSRNDSLSGDFLFVSAGKRSSIDVSLLTSTALPSPDFGDTVI